MCVSPSTGARSSPCMLGLEGLIYCATYASPQQCLVHRRREHLAGDLGSRLAAACGSLCGNFSALAAGWPLRQQTSYWRRWLCCRAQHLLPGSTPAPAPRLPPPRTETWWPLQAESTVLSGMGGCIAGCIVRGSAANQRHAQHRPAPEHGCSCNEATLSFSCKAGCIAMHRSQVQAPRLPAPRTASWWPLQERSAYCFDMICCCIAHHVMFGSLTQASAIQRAWSSSVPHKAHQSPVSYLMVPSARRECRGFTCHHHMIPGHISVSCAG
jgi:hypothetical protein